MWCCIWSICGGGDNLWRHVSVINSVERIFIRSDFRYQQKSDTREEKHWGHHSLGIWPSALTISPSFCDLKLAKLIFRIWNPKINLKNPLWSYIMPIYASGYWWLSWTSTTAPKARQLKVGAPSSHRFYSCIWLQLYNSRFLVITHQIHKFLVKIKEFWREL